jgi:phosphinothricin acetyltransferase
MKPEIRKASLADVKAITDIYNEAILTTTATFDIQPKTLTSQKKWFQAHGNSNPVFVNIVGGDVVGWVSLSAYSDRCAYSGTAELSLYIKESYRNQGIGKALLSAVLVEGKKVGLHTVISRIAGDNDVSLHLHREFGFREIGVMNEVGRKFGKLLDVVLMQKML